LQKITGNVPLISKSITYKSVYSAAEVDSTEMRHFARATKDKGAN